MTAVADTSWLYAAFTSNDAHHGKARAGLAEPEPLQVPPVILAEWLNLMTNRHGRDAAEQAVKALRSLPQVVFPSETDLPGADRLWRQHRSLSFSDACAVAAALSVQGRLLTFDKDQLAALAKAGSRRGPPPG